MLKTWKTAKELRECVVEAVCALFDDVPRVEIDTLENDRTTGYGHEIDEWIGLRYSGEVYALREFLGRAV